MDVVVAGTMAMEQAALQQVCLARGRCFVDGHRQIVVTLPMRASHSGDHVAVAAAHISPAALPLEEVNTWRSHIIQSIALLKTSTGIAENRKALSKLLLNRPELWEIHLAKGVLETEATIDMSGLFRILDEPLVKETLTYG